MEMDQPPPVAAKKPSGMRCAVPEDSVSKTEPIRLTDPMIFNVLPPEGENATIVEYRLRGALFDAVPRDAAAAGSEQLEGLVCKTTTMRCDAESPDVLGISPCAISNENDFDYGTVKRVELWLGSSFFAVGSFDPTTGVVRYSEERMAIPLLSIPDIPVVTRIYVTDPDCDPKTLYSGANVVDEDKHKIKSAKVNLAFTYAATNDMNVLSVGRNAAGLQHPRSVSGSDRVCCLHSDVPPEKAKELAFASRQELVEWLDEHYVYCPPLPITVKVLE